VTWAIPPIFEGSIIKPWARFKSARKASVEFTNGKRPERVMRRVQLEGGSRFIIRRWDMPKRVARPFA